MDFPLIICDSDGRLVYKSRSVKTGGFFSKYKNAIAIAQQDGVLKIGKRICFVKIIPLCGRRYFFFIDYESLAANCQSFANEVAEKLFNFNLYANERRNVRLRDLLEMFKNTSLQKLNEDGVCVSVQELIDDTAVCVSPGMFILTLSLMIRLTAKFSRVVRLSVAHECGRLTVFCHGKKNSPVPLEEYDFLEMLLYECAAGAGFAVEKSVKNDSFGFSLELSPLDIGLLGMKVPLIKSDNGICQCYISIFL